MKFILYGASGHGLVVKDILSAGGAGKVIAFIDDNKIAGGAKAGIPVIPISKIPRSLLRDADVRALVTIGANSVRAAKAAELTRLGLTLGVATHPSAAVAPSVLVGAGTVIMAQAAINAASRIGKNVIINTGATIDHECVIDDGAHVSPGAHLAGNVVVGARAHVGIGATIIQGITIGADAVVGAGAVVIRDVRPGATVVGNPARELACRGRG